MFPSCVLNIQNIYDSYVWNIANYEEVLNYRHKIHWSQHNEATHDIGIWNFKVAVNPKTTNFYNVIARAIFFLYSILSII